MEPAETPKRAPRIAAMSLAMLLLLGAFLVWSFAEPRTLRINEVTVVSPDLPPEFSGTRVAFLADVHAGPYYSERRVAKLVDRVNGLGADLILIGGDNVGGRSSGADAFYPEAGRLSAPLGVYGVLGNHDYWEGEALARRLAAEAGITLLDNSNATVRKGDASIRLGGVGDFWEGSTDFVKAAQGISERDFALLMCHNPDALAEGLLKTPNVWDVALTGHMHAGQITFFGLWAPIVPSIYGQRYRVGWREENGCLILTTSGVGTVTMPVRFFAPPEVNLITLQRGPEPTVRGARVKR